MSTINELYYVRAPGAAHASSGEHYLCVRPGRLPLQIAQDDAPKIAQILAELWRPRPRSEVLDAVDDATLQLFVDEGLVIEGSERALAERTDLAVPAAPQRCLVLGISGASASAFMAPQVRLLQEAVASRVEIIMTRSAQHFLNPRIFEHMGIDVWTDDFARPAQRDASVRVPHMHLARAADLVLIMPASARTIARLAHGSCSDLLSLTVTATRAPVIVAPSMNAQMFWSPAVQRNLSQLQADGMFVVSPGVSRALVDGPAAGSAFGALGAVDAALVELLECVLAMRAQPEAVGRVSSQLAAAAGGAA